MKSLDVTCELTDIPQFESCKINAFILILTNFHTKLGYDKLTASTLIHDPPKLIHIQNIFFLSLLLHLTNQKIFLHEEKKKKNIFFYAFALIWFSFHFWQQKGERCTIHLNFIMLTERENFQSLI